MIAVPEIALATIADAQAIAVLARDEIEHGLGWSWTPARVQHCIRDPRSNVIVARDGAGVIGVAPAWRRRGVASALWAWLEATLRTAGIRSAQVELRASNLAARAFYERVGFEQVNATQRYYRGVETTLHMVKELTAGSS